jgi:hypothetical protein
MDRNRSYVFDYQYRQTILDPEKSIHNANLYAIWNGKSFLMHHAASVNKYHSSFFIYTDIGAFREVVFDDWPDVQFCVELEKYLNDRILLGQIFNQLADPYTTYTQYIQGGFFAGSRRAVLEFEHNFYELHDFLIDHGFFIGKDQQIMNIMSIDKLYRSRIARLKSPDSFVKKCLMNGDRWFFYQNFFAQSNQLRQCSQLKQRLSSQFINFSDDL